MDKFDVKALSPAQQVNSRLRQLYTFQVDAFAKEYQERLARIVSVGCTPEAPAS